VPGPSLAGFAVARSRVGPASLEWIVVARRSVEVAALTWRAVVNGILLLGAILAIVGIVLAAMLAGRVARPLRGLIVEADRIGRDPTATMVGRYSGSREVVHLSTSMRSLVRRLGSAEERTLLIERQAAEEARILSENVEVLRTLAHADPMTGLPNRRAFASASAEALAEFEEKRVSLAVLVIDIDHFKRVNDTFGHSAGDAVLRATASLLQSLVRSSDLVSRYGGEEFVALLRDIRPEAARGLAETLRGAIGAMRVNVDGRDIGVTVSIGVAFAQTTDRDFEDVFQRADLALYTAKRSGRNQVQEAPNGDGVLMAAE
jgi:diguanylate cyclase (GGDEF)-like protein